MVKHNTVRHARNLSAALRSERKPRSPSFRPDTFEAAGIGLEGYVPIGVHGGHV